MNAQFKVWCLSMDQRVGRQANGAEHTWMQSTGNALLFMFNDGLTAIYFKEKIFKKERKPNQFANNV